MSLLVAAAVFLRWTPHHGWFTATLIMVSVTTAAAISFTLKRRLRCAIEGIQREAISPDIASVAAVSVSVVVLAVLGIWTVLLVPPEP